MFHKGGIMRITDTELKIKGIQALNDTLGEVGAERFITLVLREPFDYTKWQRDLFGDDSIETISKKAMLLQTNKTEQKH